MNMRNFHIRIVFQLFPVNCKTSQELFTFPEIKFILFLCPLNILYVEIYNQSLQAVQTNSKYLCILRCLLPLEFPERGSGTTRDKKKNHSIKKKGLHHCSWAVNPDR
jgi:hypothetical protein